MNNLPDTRHQTPDTNRVKDGILLIIVCTCITCFLWSCEHNFDELATDENGEINYHIEAETASILEAKALFHSKKHRDALPLKKQSSDLEINPDWNSVGYHQISYTEALLGKADVNVNRKGSYYSELLFIKHKGVVKSVIFTVWPANFNENGDILDAKVYINDLDGSFLDGYRIEGGKFTKRFVLNQAKVHSAGLFMFLFQQDDDCWNTDTLDLYPGGVLDEVTLHASTDENGNAQGGSATGYIGYYSIINGAATDGSSTTGSGSTDANGITDTEMTSAAGTIITLPPEEGCPPGYVKNKEGECVEKPCPGDPVKNPEIAPQTNSGINGGRFGNTRTGGRQFHGGLDIKASYGEPVFALFDGQAQSISKYYSSAGNIVYQTAIVNGKTISIQYFHLQKENRFTGAVKAGDIIGYVGDSGNLKRAIEQGLSESHVHIKIKDSGGNLLNPEDYLTTKFDLQGNPINNCN